MPHCLNPKTVKRIDIEKFDGTNWEEQMKTSDIATRSKPQSTSNSKDTPSSRSKATPPGQAPPPLMPLPPAAPSMGVNQQSEYPQRTGAMAYQPQNHIPYHNNQMYHPYPPAVFHF